MTDRTATLTFSDGTRADRFPVLPGTIGPDVIDIRALYAKTGKFTYDPGFMSTASCTSDDHLHRRRQGRAALPRLPDRAARGALRLPRSLLPAAERRAAERGAEGRVRRRSSRTHTMVHEQLSQFFRGSGATAHPMAVMVGVVGALSAFYHDSLDINDPHHREISAFRLIAKLPTHRGDVLQVQHGPAVHVSAQRALLRGELHAHDVRRCRARNTRSTRCWCARWTASSSCTPTTSRTPRPRRCGWPARPAPIRSPASPRASPACGGRRTAAPTRRR